MSYWNKKILYNHASVFAAPIHKVKYQGRIELGNDEFAFCKEKWHWKSQCPKLLKANKKNLKSPSSNITVVAHTTIDFSSINVYPFEITSQIFDIAKWIQKIFAT